VENIGIFSCSSGGQLAAMATAWFQMHSLPRLGALGIYSAGATSNSPGDVVLFNMYFSFATIYKLKEAILFLRVQIILHRQNLITILK
jgi:hypothetical protein